jgi:excisionase family DNA binding protein
MTQEEIKQIANEVVNNTIFCTKEVLTSDEAAAYMGISLSYLYKLTMKKLIPHYKPMGKMCYFNRKELESWLQSNRVAVVEEPNINAGIMDKPKSKHGERFIKVKVTIKTWTEVEVITYYDTYSESFLIPDNYQDDCKVIKWSYA